MLSNFSRICWSPASGAWSSNGTAAPAPDSRQQRCHRCSHRDQLPVGGRHHWRIASGGARQPNQYRLPPLAEQIIWRSTWLRSLFVILSLGMASVLIGLTLYFQVRDTLPGLYRRLRRSQPGSRAQTILGALPLLGVLRTRRMDGYSGSGNFASLLDFCRRACITVVGRELSRAAAARQPQERRLCTGAGDTHPWQPPGGGGYLHPLPGADLLLWDICLRESAGERLTTFNRGPDCSSDLGDGVPRSIPASPSTRGARRPALGGKASSAVVSEDSKSRRTSLLKDSDNQDLRHLLRLIHDAS